MNLKVAWTDGACVGKQDARFRRIECGIFYGDRDKEPVLHLDWRRANKPSCRTSRGHHRDESSCRRLRDLIGQRVRRAISQKARGGSSALTKVIQTLWTDFRDEVVRNPTRHLRLVWAKRPRDKKRHVDRGVASMLHKGGNDAAGTLASAAHHATPTEMTEAAARRQRAALDTRLYSAEFLLKTEASCAVRPE